MTKTADKTAMTPPLTVKPGDWVRVKGISGIWRVRTVRDEAEKPLHLDGGSDYEHGFYWPMRDILEVRPALPAQPVAPAQERTETRHQNTDCPECDETKSVRAFTLIDRADIGECERCGWVGKLASPAPTPREETTPRTAEDHNGSV